MRPIHLLGVIAATVFAASASAQTMTIQSGSPTGSWYPASVAITKKMQELNSGLAITVAPGGALENAKAASFGQDTDMAMTYASSWHGALRGNMPFKRKWPDSRFVMALFQVVYHGGVPADSPVMSYADLNGKRIMPGKKSWATNTMTREILAQHGITYEGIRDAGGKVEHVGYDDMARSIADRQTDFIAAFQGYPTALWINVHNSRPMRFLPLPDATVDALVEKIPGLFRATLPAGTYAINADKDIPTIGDVTVVIAHKDFNPEVVYQFVKTTMEHTDELVSASKGLSFVSKDTVLIGKADGQVHPGAQRYFDEVGVSAPR